MSKRWSFVFIIISLCLCIIGAVADDWGQQRGNHNGGFGQYGQYSTPAWHHNNPSWSYPSWSYPSWSYPSADYHWFWGQSWQPTWSYYSTPVWQYTTPVVQYSTPAYVNWNTCEICFPATTIGSRSYYSLSMTRYYSVGSTSLAFPVGLWW
jgi:hypothetical protein